jgi:transcriptional regulator with XRE-family HTH domain
VGTVERVATDSNIGQFLRARREQVRPEDVGLAPHGRRRVPGLRREELAMLAGVSVDYYVRLEQGRERHPSEHVLQSLARALQLDEAATRYLLDLARAPTRRRRQRPRAERVGQGVERLVSRLHTPALVFGRRMDVLYANPMADAMHGRPMRGTNIVRSLFLDEGACGFYPEWETVALETVAALRASAGTDLDDPRLTDLVGELSLKSEDFRGMWARHDVREKANGAKRFAHPIVGEFALAYESFAIGSAPGQLLVVYHAEPGTPDEQALQLLGTLTAGNQPAPANATE